MATQVGVTEAKRQKDPDDMSFKEAFNYFKNVKNQKEFTWRDKRYTTETMDERRQAAYKDESRRKDVAPKREQARSAEVPAPMGEGPDVKPPTRGERLRAGAADTATKALAALGVAGGAYGAARALRAERAARESAGAAAAMRETAPILRRSGEGVEASAALARKEAMKEPPMSRAMSAEERRAAMMKAEKEKKSPRSRTREEDKTEYAKGGMAKKKMSYAKGGAVMANCGASMKPQQRKK